LQHLKIFRLCIFVGSFVILYSSTLAFGDSHLDTSVLFEKAKEAVKVGEYEKSIEYFDKILEQEPSNIDVLINKGAALIELEKYQEAILGYDKILENDVNNIRALNNKGFALIKLEKYDEAVANFDQIFEIDPLHETALGNMSFLFKKMGFLSIQGSKYSAHLLLQLRNSEGTLIAVLEPHKFRYRPSAITDEFLESYPVLEKFEKDGKEFETRKIVISFNPETDYFIGTTLIGPEKFRYSIVVFSTLHHALVVEKGDTVEAVWTITTEKNI